MMTLFSKRAPRYFWNTLHKHSSAACGRALRRSRAGWSVETHASVAAMAVAHAAAVAPVAEVAPVAAVAPVEEPTRQEAVAVQRHGEDAAHVKLQMDPSTNPLLVAKRASNKDPNFTPVNLNSA